MAGREMTPASYPQTSKLTLLLSTTWVSALPSAQKCILQTSDVQQEVQVQAPMQTVRAYICRQQERHTPIALHVKDDPAAKLVPTLWVLLTLHAHI